MASPRRTPYLAGGTLTLTLTLTLKPLQAEVDGIKAHKVALARKMREAQDTHRAQRLEREREIKALRRKVRWPALTALLT